MMTNEEYHARPEASKSQLDLLARSPAHYMEGLRRKRKQTPAFSVGTEAHRLILEPETESTAIPRPDKGRRSNADKEAWMLFFADNGANALAIATLPAGEWDAEFTRQTGRHLLTQEQFDAVRAMRESVFAHPAAAGLLENGVAERSLFWSDAHTGVRCRCRPDWIHDDAILVDLKTTDDASPAAFAKSVAKYRYHVQDAFYSDGFAAEKGRDGVPPFVFIAVEKLPPYAVGVYQLEPAARELGRKLYNRDLERLAEALATDCWRAYSDDIETASLPAWAYYEGDKL